MISWIRNLCLIIVGSGWSKLNNKFSKLCTLQGGSELVHTHFPSITCKPVYIFWINLHFELVYPMKRLFRWNFCIIYPLLHSHRSILCLQKDEFLKLYSFYCQNVIKSDKLRDKVGEKNEFFLSCQMKLGHKLPLAAYMLKPVQRITKYQLLLKVSTWHLLTD